MASKNPSKRKSYTSHDEVIAGRLSKDTHFAAEYLKAALEDADDPSSLVIALRHLAQAQTLLRRIRR
jgi:DNA-binding phage protein